MNTLLPDDPDSKLNACVGNILRIWQDGQADKLTQLVFCDLSTPKNDGTFNVYDDVKTKLIANGVPAEEVAFIHDADTEAKKKDLFAKVRTGQVRVLLGSTQKMGAGTNVQDKLVAVHHLDVGWRPSDMTQRNGRIIRQGNRNKEVQVVSVCDRGNLRCLPVSDLGKQAEVYFSDYDLQITGSPPVTMWMSRRCPMRRSRRCVPAIRLSRKRWT